MSFLLEESGASYRVLNNKCLPEHHPPKIVDYDHLKALRLMFKTPTPKKRTFIANPELCQFTGGSQQGFSLFLPVHLASQSPFTVHGDIVKRSTMPQNFARCDDSFKKLPIKNYTLLIYRWRGLSPSGEDAHQTFHHFGAATHFPQNVSKGNHQSKCFLKQPGAMQCFSR